MPITALYTWSENAEGLEVVVQLKGNKASSADVFAAENYVKVSFGSYLLELDLMGGIDDTKVKATAKNGNLILKLQKLIPQLWGGLVVTGLDKATVRERRKTAVEARRQKEIQLHQDAKSKRVDIERTTLRAQMSMEAAERQELEDLKAEEKKRAEEEVYETFSRMEAERRQQEEKQVGASQPKKAMERAGDGEEDSQPPPLVDGGKPQEDPMKGDIFDNLDDDIDDNDDDEDEEVQDASPRRAGVAEGSREGGEIVEKAEEDEEEEYVTVEHEEAAGATAYVPAPRGSERVKIGFTPRVFPTPMRESKRQEEEDWIARNRPHLRSNKTLASMGGDTRDISESDPVWLKGKGDDFFRSGDFHSASNAYAACLEVQPDQPKVWANRAACQLQLGRARACVDDCTRGLSLAVLPEAQAGEGDSMQVHHMQQLRLKMHVRRAAALVQLADYDRAAEDFRAALYHAATDAELASDLRQVEVLAECGKVKRAADEKVGQGDLKGAVELYSKGLQLVPTFVSCLSNRAAAHMASGDFSACVADCDEALSCIEAEQGTSGLTGVPPAGSERRRLSVLRTVARRGAAKLARGDLPGAKADVEGALTLAKGKEEAEGLERDVTEIEARMSAASVRAD